MSAPMRPEENFFCQRVQDNSEINLEFETLLDYLKHSCGCDLTSYKRSSLMRRFQHRMRTLQINTYPCYLQYLKAHAHEYLALLNDVLINCTGFFRDRDTWEYLATEVIPTIIARKRSDASIRIWSAGCAAGQEIYSILILLAEALGLEACLQRVQCFATDVDESALLQARQATYSHRDVMGIDPDLLKKYFEPTETGYIFHPLLRRTVGLSHHDLTQNAPIPSIDLLLCRNVLMYFNPDAQATILSRLHLALADGGFLCVGQTEMLIHYRQTFTPINRRQRIYTKALELDLDDYRSVTTLTPYQQPTKVLPEQRHFWKAAFENSLLPYLAVDVNGDLIDVNEQARTMFGLTANDWKRPFAELELAQLISASTSTNIFHSQQHLTISKDFMWVTETGIRYFDVHSSRILAPNNDLLGVMLTFIDITHYKQRIEELEATCSGLADAAQTLENRNLELKMVYEELASVQQELQFAYPQRRCIDQDR